MNTFTKTDLGVRDMKKDELDEIALKGGRVGGIGYGYATRDHALPDQHGYGFKWINTRGTGNCGTLILTARSKNAAEHLRMGKVHKFMDRYGLDFFDADALYSAAKSITYGLEQEVLDYAVDNSDYLAWVHFPGVGKGVWNWFAKYEMPRPCALSAYRLQAAYRIIKEWNKWDQEHIALANLMKV